MTKQSYFEGWGYSDTVKLLIKGTQANRDAFYKELKVTFPTDDIEKVGGTSIEAFVYERQIPVVKKMATVFKMKIAYEGGGKTGDIEIAKIILDQLGGQRRLVVMTGANNFIAVKNGLSFKLKSRIANYVKIVLNGNDLYDIEFQKLISTKSKKVAEYNDIYFDQLIPIVEKETGMYLKLFKKGGFVSTQNRDMVLSQLKSIHHHEIELRSALKTSPEIEAWVLAKVQRATTDLSDITHYLDGKTEYKTGGDIKPFKTKANGSTIYINGTKADVKKMYLDFVNNFLTIGSFADHYNISDKQASLIIESGRNYAKKDGYFNTGGTTPEIMDLFEDYENIPPKVQKILDKYEESFEDGDYQGLNKAHAELGKIGYTFEFYLDGVAYGLRPENIELNQLKGYEEFAEGGKVTKPKRKNLGDIGQSGTQYGYTLKEYEALAEKNNLFVSPSQWWKSQEGKTYKDSFGRTKTIGQHSRDKEQEMIAYGYRIAIGIDLGSSKIPTSAKKYVQDNNLNKFAEGGVAQGFSVADANPYIAGAKAVQGIAPQSVSAIDQRIASKLNPDPNRPVFFAVGGKVGDYVQFKGVDDEVRTGIITEDLGGDNYAVSSGFGQVLVNSDNYIGKTTKPVERKRFLGLFKDGGKTCNY
jgi:hypothetical protein